MPEICNPDNETELIAVDDPFAKETEIRDVHNGEAWIAIDMHAARDLPDCR